MTQKLGQHFLKNKRVAEKIIDSVALQDGDVVFEIGPGHGELTEKLKIETGNLKVISIEKDEKLYEALKNQFENNGEIEIVFGDALIKLPLLIEEQKESKYKVVGNIPYYITGYLLRVISELNNKPERTVLMIQKEVAERITMQPPKMNRLAASVQFWAKPTIIINVPKEDFSPMPKIDSAVILLVKKDNRPACNMEYYYAAVRALFSQPRKTILNNVYENIIMEGDSEHKKKKIVTVLEKIKINPQHRPQNLSVEDIILIAREFFKVS